MKDGAKIALDTMTGIELLQSANLCLKNNQGDCRYKAMVSNIVADAVNVSNFYVTLKMRRTLMGFIRPVFEVEWARRNRNRIQQTLV